VFPIGHRRYCGTRITSTPPLHDAQRRHIWDRVSGRLNSLDNRITPDDRKKIEAAIAERVPRPKPDEYKEIARRSVQILGWEWVADHFRAALADEADNWKDNGGSR
jgi:hypothetical protein